MRKSHDRVQTSVGLDRDVYDSLNKEADQEGLTLADIVRRHLKRSPGFRVQEPSDSTALMEHLAKEAS